MIASAHTHAGLQPTINRADQGSAREMGILYAPTRKDNADIARYERTLERAEYPRWE
jgi:hypothetical protein